MCLNGLMIFTPKDNSFSIPSNFNEIFSFGNYRTIVLSQIDVAPIGDLEQL